MERMIYREQLAKYAKRREAIRDLRGRGWTLVKIAKHFEITKQRVSQILSNGVQ